MAAPARVVFFGNERLSSGYTTQAPTLRRLVSAGYDVKAVVTNHSSSRSRRERQLEIQVVADEFGIPILMPNKPSEILDTLQAMQPDVGVLVAYGRIIPQSVIDIFAHGILNIHPSLLPLHRGSIPIESAILHGERETGVSIMSLVKAMDAGPVYRQEHLALHGDETKQALTDQLLHMGGQSLLDCLPAILDGSLQPTPQDDSQATYDQLLTAADGILDFNKPAVRLEREIRAYAGWPRSRTQLAGKDVIIHRAHVTAACHGAPGSIAALPDTGVIMIATTEGSLCIDELQPAGKSAMSAGAFMHGLNGSHL